MNLTVAFAAPQDWGTYREEFSDMRLDLYYVKSRYSVGVPIDFASHTALSKMNKKRLKADYNANHAMAGIISSLRLYQISKRQDSKDKYIGYARQFIEDYKSLRGNMSEGKVYRNIAFIFWNLQESIANVKEFLDMAWQREPNDGLLAALYARFEASNHNAFDKEIMLKDIKYLRERFPDIGDLVIIQAELEEPNSYYGRISYLKDNIAKPMYYLYGEDYLDEYIKSPHTQRMIPIVQRPSRDYSSGGYSGGGSSDSGYSDEELYYMDKQMKEDAARIEQDRLKAIPNIPDHW